MRLCELIGCERKHYAKNYCSPHYQQWKARDYPPNWNPSPDFIAHPTNWERRRQTILRDIPGIVIPLDLWYPRCRVTGCDEHRHSDEYCEEHFKLLSQYDCLEDWTLAIIPRYCKYPGCTNSPWVNGLCVKCYRRWEKNEFPKRWFMKPEPALINPGCFLSGCKNKHHAKGRCRIHYMRRYHKQKAAQSAA